MINAYLELDREKSSELLAFESLDNRTLPHFHSNIELVYVTEGEITVTINGNSAVLKKGDVSAALSYDIHSYYTDKTSKSIILVVPCELVNSFMSASSGKTFSSPFLIAKDCNMEIFCCLEKILLENVKNNLLKIKGYIYVILSLLIENLGFSENKKTDMNFLPQKALIFIHENYLKNISLTDMSKKLGYNKCYISKLLNNYFGCGYNEFINTLRVKYASVLLSESKQSVIEVALNSGFENQRTFNRSFMNSFGMTPSEYRKKIKELQ